MAFFGAVVKPGKPTPSVPHSEGWNLHLSQAALPATVPEGRRVSLAVQHEKDKPIIVATLVAGKADSVPLDLFFDEYVEFTLQGNNLDKVEVHISGYYSPEPQQEDEEEDEDHPLIYPPGFGDEDEEDEDEDYEDEDEDEDEDEEMEGAGRARRKPQVTIEEIDDAGHSKALVPVSKKAPAVQEDEDEDEEDEDEGEDDDEDEDEGEEEDEEEEEEEEEPAPVKGKAQVGSKRPAEQVSKAQQQQPNKKQAVAQQQQEKQDKQAKQQQQQQQEKQHAKQQQAKQQQEKQQPAKQQEKQQQQQGKQQEKQQQQGKQQEKQQQQGKKGGDSKAGEVSTNKKNVRRWENGFEIEEVKMGNANGKLAKAGKRVLVQYVGRLKSNGKVFDKSSGKPFSFRLGVGEVIKGWDVGVEGMRVGDKRKLVIPPQFAYGTSGVKGTIPPNATLEFDVELVDVK
eukprot:CAMPEP_0202904994 /NCGR_PEP_ID=MMETSP1392-20130828/32009_1 /ASSEMBLY_ACC=CAM_ASM_000868 /TAXON_ID=225041 /ORGANISM="Chlamydomonas chlamydogama, Strain SAG 11-48b" /LENGTH=452 /DNA_ID=CAMNT_0049592893 /DNA_START=45 /DNA_END=1403 /DNA_ORIENTATION=-